MLCLLLLLTCLCSCQPPEEPAPQEDTEYVVLFYTNTHYSVVTSDVATLRSLFGENDPTSDRMYAAGFVGPCLLTQSVAEMREQLAAAFRYAERYDVPVYFNLDDCNNYYWYISNAYFGKGVETRFWEDPEMCEWTYFPEEGETWGGERISGGNVPRFWYNWGDVRYSPAFPNFASSKLQALVLKQLQEGVLEPLTEWYSKLCASGKEYLFAGISAGWETHIPDYSASNPYAESLRSGTDIVSGDRMQEWEKRQYGYGALTSLGYDQEKLEAEAAERGVGAEDRMREILYQVIHDYIELLAREINQSGIPREKIYSHVVSLASREPVDDTGTTFAPPVWTAVNEYCIPGYTMSMVSCPYDTAVLMDRIRKADPVQTAFANTEGYGSGTWNANSPAWTQADYDACDDYFQDMFGSGARLITAYGFPDDFDSIYKFYRQPEFPYVVSVNKWLRGEI